MHLHYWHFIILFLDEVLLNVSFPFSRFVGGDEWTTIDFAIQGEKGKEVVCFVDP